jgi:hypothetical protein
MQVAAAALFRHLFIRQMAKFNIAAKVTHN